jgi:hypothetical protein
MLKSTGRMLLLFLIMASCMGAGYDRSGFPGKDTEPPAAAPEPAPEDTPEETDETNEEGFEELPPRPVTLSLGLIKGKTYTYETSIYSQNTIVSVTPEIPMPDEIPGIQMTTISRMIVADDTSEDYTVTQIIDSFGAGDDENRLPQVQAVLDALTGVEITFILSPGGDVKSLSGTDAMWDRVAEASCDDPLAQRMAALLKQSISDEKLKQQMATTFGARPRVPVEPGHTWDASVPMELIAGSSSTLSINYSFDSLVDVDGVEAVVLSGYADQEFPGGLPLSSDMLKDLAPGMDMKIIIDYLGLDTVAYLRADTSELMYLSSEVIIEMRNQIHDPESGQDIEITMDVNVFTEMTPVE